MSGENSPDRKQDTTNIDIADNESMERRGEWHGECLGSWKNVIGWEGRPLAIIWGKIEDVCFDGDVEQVTKVTALKLAVSGFDLKGPSRSKGIDLGPA